MARVGFSGDVPFLSVAAGTISIEKRVAYPMLEPEPVILYFTADDLGRRTDDKARDRPLGD